MSDIGSALPIFPLEGALLFPGGSLPLHIFEPRYRTMVEDAMKGDKLIGMIQPRDGQGELFAVGCIGRILDCTPLADGRYNVILEGIARFRVRRELAVTTPYRQVEADWIAQDQQPDREISISSVLRSALETESRRFADQNGYQVDWAAVRQLDDETFIHLVSQVAPFDSAAKQALLEADTLPERAELLIQCMEFFRMLSAKGSDDSVTLQ
jgi:Lon protease-like protein